MKKVLVVVDFQNDFVDGAFGFPGAESLEPVIAGLVKSYEAAGHDVIFTKTVHPKNYLETKEGKEVGVAFCVAGSGGEEFYGGIKRLASRHVIFEKNTFASARLEQYLFSHPHDEVEFCGLDLANCVLANAEALRKSCPSAKIRILCKASGCADPAMKESAMEKAKAAQIEIVE